MSMNRRETKLNPIAAISFFDSPITFSPKIFPVAAMAAG